ncbi:Ion channel [Marinospirillum celere]|uniref:Ion channel n=1 Tax=Marinospirillum celere TaxID=1122252 RepID=A0A1I1HZL1_9GAMM|nr:potassium channel family protein [Marinospirillum celere]SFC29336.1 Ion channel [Marinospirillum celere]
MANRLYEILWKLWAVIVFVGVPIGYTATLFNPNSSLGAGVLIFSVISIFATSFWNVFTRLRDYRLGPQIGKMLLAVYVSIFGFATLYRQSGLVESGVVTHEPWDALYFSIVTWTTLGYGDFQPVETVRLLAALQAMLGTLFIPLLLAAIVFTLQKYELPNK